MSFSDPLLSSDSVLISVPSLSSTVDPGLEASTLATSLTNEGFLPPSPPWDYDSSGHNDSGFTNNDFEDFIESWLKEGEPSLDESLESFNDATTDLVADWSQNSPRSFPDLLDLDDEGILSPANSLSSGSSSTSGDELAANLVTQDNDNPSSKWSQQVFHCSVCKLAFNTAEALRTHSSKEKLKCCMCGKRFSTHAKLVSHQRKHSKEKPFECVTCGRFYTHRTTLVRHQARYCATLRAKLEDANSKKQISSLTGHSTKQNEIASTFIQPSPLRLATSTVVLPTKVSLVKGRQDSTTINAKSQKSSKPLSETECKVCQKEFFDAVSLKAHFDKNLNLKTCCLCGKTLGNKSKLLTHHRCHTKESPYKCQTCGKAFSENSTLRKHEATHGEKNFACKLCDKAFARKDYLDKHALTHQQQMYKCAICDFVCHNRGDIGSHYAQKHPSA